MMRSVPTSRGLSVSTGMPVRTPGSTTTLGRSAKWFASISRHSCSTAGTVAQTEMPSTSSIRSPSRPRISTAHSSAVRWAAVATRQSRLTCPSAISPSTVWLLPMSAARRVTLVLEIHPDVEDDHRVGQGPDGDEVDPGLGHLAGPLQGQASRRLQAGAAGGEPDRLGHGRRVHVVEQDAVAAGVEQGAELVEVGDLDLDREVGVGRPDGGVGRHHAAGGDHVVVLDHRHVAQREPVVDAPAAPDGVLLQGTQARQGLAGVQHPGAGALERVDPASGGRGDAGEVAGQVEGGALGGEQPAGGARDPHHHVARGHPAPLVDAVLDGEVVGRPRCGAPSRRR